MAKKPLFSREEGQVLLIVVLIMVVALTVGLALVARSITNLRNTNDDASSQKAFGAAEAGIELGLKLSNSQVGSVISQKQLPANGATIKTVTITNLSGSSLVLNNGNPIAQDEGIDVWLTSYPDYSGTPWTGRMYVDWGNKSGCQDAALEVLVLSGTSKSDQNLSVTRYGIEPCGSIDVSQNRQAANNFSSPSSGGTVNGRTFKFSTRIDITNGLVARIIPLYASTPVGIVGTTSVDPFPALAFPSQGRILNSIGVSGSTQRQVSFFQGYPMLPTEFFYALFNP